MGKDTTNMENSRTRASWRKRERFPEESVEFQIPSAKVLFRRIKERDALHEHTAQRAHVAEQREAELRNLLKTEENECVSMTDSTKRWTIPKTWGHFLEKVCRQPVPVLSIIGRKKPKDSPKKSSILKSASVNASAKVTDSASILTALDSLGRP